MYDELVKALRDMSKMGMKYGMAVVKMREAAEAIEELQAVVDGFKAQTNMVFEETEGRTVIKFEPKWIPVTERLPECDLSAEVGNIEWISCGIIHAGCFGRGGKYRDAYFSDMDGGRRRGNGRKGR